MRFVNIFLFLALHSVSMAQNMGVKLPVSTTPVTTLDVNGSVAFREGPSSLILVNGVNDNIVLGDYSLFRITGPTGAFSITGFLGGQNGRVLTIINATTQVLSLTHQASSTANNQINTGGNTLTVAANGVATFIYNTTLSNWVLSGGQGFTNIAWGLTGNSGTVDGTNFLGTIDNVPFNIKVNNQKAGRIDHLLGNAYFGYQSGNATTSGNANVFLGHQSGMNTTTGSANAALGNAALRDNITGQENVAIGSEALKLNTTGNYNTAVGNNAMIQNATGYSNVSIGYLSLQKNNSGSHNTAVGVYALRENTTGTSNTATGFGAAQNNTTGYYNTFNGYSAGFNNTTGRQNLFIGYESGYSSTTVNDNQYVGHQAGYSNTTGTGNQYQGFQSGYNSTIGANNTFLGYNTGSTNTTGSNNTLLGYQANVSAAALTNATAIGYNAIVGANNSLVLGGMGANAVNVGMGTTTPLYKVHVEEPGGYNGDIAIRLYNTNNSAFLPSLILQTARGTKTLPSAVTSGTILGTVRYGGYDGSAFSDIYAAELRGNATENWSTTAHGTSVNIGTIANGTTTLLDRMIIDQNGRVGIGCAAPAYKLHVNGDGGFLGNVRATGSITAGTSVTACSDLRFKTNIHPLSNALKNVLKMNGVTYDWRIKEFPDWSFNDRKQIGVIAQDLEKLYPELITVDEKGYLSVDYSKITPILIEAVKDLNTENDKLKAEVERLKAENAILNKTVKINSQDIEQIKQMLAKRND